MKESDSAAVGAENNGKNNKNGVDAAKAAARKKRRFERWFAFLRFIARLICILYPMKRHNEVKSYGDGPYVMLCNHYRMLDVLYPVIAIKKPLHYMAKKDLWDNKFLNWFCNKCQCIPVSRDGDSMDVKGIMTAMRYLKNGENILIYPEGTRNKGEADMLPFKGGFAAIAIKTRTPIIPIVQSRKPKIFRTTHVFYGAPIEFTEFYGKKLTEEEIAECEKQLRDKMLKMRNDFFEEERRRREAKGKK